MTLLQLTEPLFQYVCCLTRSEAAGASLDVDEVRSGIRGILMEIRTKAEAHPSLAYQYDQTIYLILIFFVDFMIKESNLDIAQAWTELAIEENELAGDEQFFDLLEKTLVRSTEVATQQLPVFHQCLTLGFTGCHSDDWETIRRKRAEIEAKMRGETLGLSEKVTPKAYEHVDQRRLRLRPLRLLALLKAGLVLLLVFLVSSNVFLYVRSTNKMRESLQEINRITLEQSNQLVDAATRSRE